MTRRYIKIPSNKLSLKRIKEDQKEGRSCGWDEIAYFYHDADDPYMKVKVDEDVKHGIAINHD